MMSKIHAPFQKYIRSFEVINFVCPSIFPFLYIFTALTIKLSYHFIEKQNGVEFILIAQGDREGDCIFCFTTS